MMSCTREGALGSFMITLILSNTCLWYEPYKNILFCCHEMHWTTEDMYWAATWDPQTDEPWREHICMACVLGECATVKKKQS